MGFLIRCVFWLSLALLFIPLDVDGETPQSETVGPLQALVAAREAIRDVTSICERQPEVCATASAAIDTITSRAMEGVRIARELIENENAPKPQTAEKAPAEAQVDKTGSIPPAN